MYPQKTYIGQRTVRLRNVHRTWALWHCASLFPDDQQWIYQGAEIILMPALSAAPEKPGVGEAGSWDPGATPTWRQAGREGLGTPQRRHQLLPGSKHDCHAGDFCVLTQSNTSFKLNQRRLKCSNEESPLETVGGVTASARRVGGKMTDGGWRGGWESQGTSAQRLPSGGSQTTPSSRAGPSGPHSSPPRRLRHQGEHWAAGSQ